MVPAENQSRHPCPSFFVDAARDIAGNMYYLCVCGGLIGIERQYCHPDCDYEYQERQPKQPPFLQFLDGSGARRAFKAALASTPPTDDHFAEEYRQRNSFRTDERNHIEDQKRLLTQCNSRWKKDAAEEALGVNTKSNLR